uniref:NADH-ubiquinone oxidoreductase chain 4L n=1 Tax=Mastigoproctus giganteus TaxID=58767 RepID=B1Q0G0_MASGI|nr:NADH dehydrogenase subunit 4L [Mastigoproctus giganteus]
MMMIWGGSMAIFIAGLSSFIFRFKHVILMLLSLEMMMLGIFLGLVYILVGSSFEWLILMFIPMMICEGGLGLGLLVFMIRSFGSDYVNLSII